MTGPVAIIVIAAIVIIWAVATSASRQQIQRAKEKGMWPAEGQIPTDEDVKRLAKGGQKLLAIKLCRQIHGIGLAEAKAAVEKMAEPPADGDGKPTSQT